MTDGKTPRGRPRPRRRGFDDVAKLSDAEVERRVELRPPALAKPAADTSPATVPAAPIADRTGSALGGQPSTTRVQPSGVHVALDPRRVLWRDSAMILVVVLLGLLAAQTFLPGDNGQPIDTPLPSGIVTGSLPPGATLPPGVTFGPIVNPSLGIDATPTPIPVITLGPSPSPTPKPTPRPTPRPTVKPTPRPSVGPSPGPTGSPTATDIPTAAPTAPPTGTPITTTAPASIAPSGT